MNAGDREIEYVKEGGGGEGEEKGSARGSDDEMTLPPHVFGFASKKKKRKSQME